MSTMDSTRHAIRRLLSEAVEVAEPDPDEPRPAEAFHGTAGDFWRTGGLENIYVTRARDIAEYFAETAAEITDEPPVILRVRLPDPALLELDRNSVNEPLMSWQEPVLHEYTDRLLELYPEWEIGEGMISIPASAWWASWQALDSALYPGRIPPENIEVAYTRWRRREYD